MVSWPPVPCTTVLALVCLHPSSLFQSGPHQHRHSLASESSVTHRSAVVASPLWASGCEAVQCGSLCHTEGLHLVRTASCFSVCVHPHPCVIRTWIPLQGSTPPPDHVPGAPAPSASPRG